ncbi:glycosyltransferase [Paenarthrobacter sp. DKR-5]|uniref:glycosyltransferase family 2 protein n=1 Tax=Paenarthrobacter sp. DKR-5 TaxID=2835535 RepID=UPI001BDBD1F5|nr:glycosyltransferase [Paenarthrobacter sp. DKR-5]MBT1002783.1 glycosyltransferase [Paenarthrobacter sp. DKR-5]
MAMLAGPVVRRPGYHVIVACHNRRDTTITFLRRVRESAERASVRLTMTVYDDASSDGTAEAVLEEWPACRLLRGTGRDFWAKSMALAERSVLVSAEILDSDYVVWLNDDVALDRDAIERMASLTEAHPNAILVGAMRDPDRQDVTYSGLVKAGVHPLRFARCEPDDLTPLPVTTFNGNFVVIPVQVARRIGGIDGTFSHALADIDYGIRAGRLGIPSLLAPGTYGECGRNPSAPKASTTLEWRRFVGPKGPGNLKSLARMLRKLAPLTWPLYLGATYLLWWARVIFRGRLADV